MRIHFSIHWAASYTITRDIEDDRFRRPRNVNYKLRRIKKTPLSANSRRNYFRTHSLAPVASIRPFTNYMMYMSTYTSTFKKRFFEVALPDYREFEISLQINNTLLERNVKLTLYLFFRLILFYAIKILDYTFAVFFPIFCTAFLIMHAISQDQLFLAL